MKRADGILDKINRLRVVGKSGLDRPLYKNQLRAKIRRLILHRFLDSRKFLLQRTLKRADGILDKINRLRVVGKSGLDRPLYKNQLRAKIHRLILHSLLDSRKFLLQRTLKRADGCPDEIDSLRVVGKSQLDRRLDESEFRAQVRGLDLKSIFYGGEFLGDGSTHGIDRRDCLPYQLLILDDTALVGLCQKFYLLFKSESLIIDGLFKKIKLFRNSFGLIQKRIHQSAVIIR